jgi:hypothetical protein
MELSEEQLEAIERLAATAYPPKEVAFMLGVKPSEFCAQVKDEDSAASIAYYKGLLSSEHGVRESILSLARNGSSPAQTMANKLFDENRRNLVKGGFPSASED